MSKPRKVKGGECRICGCTDENACAGGCSWADARRTLCSACVTIARDLIEVLEEQVQRPLTRLRLDRFVAIARAQQRDAVARTRSIAHGR